VFAPRKQRIQRRSWSKTLIARHRLCVPHVLLSHERQYAAAVTRNIALCTSDNPWRRKYTVLQRLRVTRNRCHRAYAIVPQVRRPWLYQINWRYRFKENATHKREINVSLRYICCQFQSTARTQPFRELAETYLHADVVTWPLPETLFSALHLLVLSFII